MYQSVMSSKESLKLLQDMGFSADQAKQALKKANGNVDYAVNILLSSGSSPSPSSSAPAAAAAAAAAPSSSSSH